MAVPLRPRTIYRNGSSFPFVSCMFFAVCRVRIENTSFQAWFIVELPSFFVLMQKKYHSGLWPSWYILTHSNEYRRLFYDKPRFKTSYFLIRHSSKWLQYSFPHLFVFILFVSCWSVWAWDLFENCENDGWKLKSNPFLSLDGINIHCYLFYKNNNL